MGGSSTKGTRSTEGSTSKSTAKTEPTHADVRISPDRTKQQRSQSLQNQEQQLKYETSTMSVNNVHTQHLDLERQAKEKPAANQQNTLPKEPKPASSHRRPNRLMET
ncbi:hypothetical protein M513_00866 [Trichuris suis]|uniref:Uncharacterized protein n=1 Tax=Trichuris suis TaxID=68888 RepID=A0A085MLK7_9BILA|nr:hypothetical protein M513_00866 [Trichuris suis]